MTAASILQSVLYPHNIECKNVWKHFLWLGDIFLSKASTKTFNNFLQRKRKKQSNLCISVAFTIFFHQLRNAFPTTRSFFNKLIAAATILQCCYFLLHQKYFFTVNEHMTDILCRKKRHEQRKKEAFLKILPIVKNFK